MSDSSSQVNKKIANFFDSENTVEYKKGSFLIEPGDAIEKIFYIVSGTVRQFDVSPQGNELVVNIFKSGTFFPMNHAFNNSNNLYFFQAYDDVKVKKADIDKVCDFVCSDKEILIDLMSRVYKGTDGLLKRTVQLMGGNVKTRFIQELLIQADRFNEKDQNVAIPLTITELAARAGMTRETASRVTSKLRKKNLLKGDHNKLEIADIELLKKELEDEFGVN